MLEKSVKLGLMISMRLKNVKIIILIEFRQNSNLKPQQWNSSCIHIYKLCNTKFKFTVQIPYHR